jgi:hypothetical protein
VRFVYEYVYKRVSALLHISVPRWFQAHMGINISPECRTLRQYTSSTRLLQKPNAFMIVSWTRELVTITPDR